MAAGTFAQWFTFAALIFGAWRLSKGGAGSAVTELSEANRVLTRRNQDLGAEVRDLKIKMSDLETRTDFAAVISQHEQRAQERADRTLVVLDLIASRLGPDTNGHT